MKKYIVELTSEERSELKDIIKAERMAAHKRRHARILLKTDQGPQGPAWKDADIANAFDCTIKSVERLRERLKAPVPIHRMQQDETALSIFFSSEAKRSFTRVSPWLASILSGLQTDGIGGRSSKISSALLLKPEEIEKQLSKTQEPLWEYCLIHCFLFLTVIAAVFILLLCAML